MRYVTIRLDDDDFEHLSMVKGDRTWREYLMKAVLNHRLRLKLLTLAKK
jgi:hypothetical protein